MAIALPLLLVLLLGAPAIYAVDHTVGGSSGWNTNVDYSSWASGQKFVVGDNLVFNYDTTHQVDIVSGADYTNCATGNALKTYSGGQTTIPLAVVGPIYFLCPTSGHCLRGMKLAVNVSAATTTPPSSTPPPSGTPPTTTTPPGSPPPPATTTTSPPPPSGVDGSLGHLSHWMLGFSLVVAIVVMGFMG